METYIGLKQIQAEPMENDGRPGYKVVYQDGYESWSPKEVFESAYKPTDCMSFSEALFALKNGCKISRKGWNGKGMYLWLKPAAVVDSEWCHDPVLKDIAVANGGQIDALGTVCMYTHDSTGRKAILTGWLASQSDMLSNDWMIVE